MIKLDMAAGRNLYVISDTHFNHVKILEYTKRPYKTLEEMNEALIAHWQSIVSPDDYIIHCGDFFMGKSELAPPIFARLPGRKIFVRGNHDKLMRKMGLEQQCEIVGDILELQIGKQAVVLSHFPIESWNNAGKGWWHLHGHSHGNSRQIGGRLDVGVDAFCAPFGAPCSWGDVGKVMTKHPFQPQDHHGRENL